jgi:hypothetical protein
MNEVIATIALFVALLLVEIWHSEVLARQDLERELFYLSRRLSFSNEQETKVRQALVEVETHVDECFKNEKVSPNFASDLAYRDRLSMQENQFRSDWLAEQMRNILGAGQYQAYVQEEAESSAADMGIFHAP